MADGFGLAFLLLSKNQPNVPIAISLLIFIAIFLVSSFFVWHEEVQKRAKLQSKLDKIKDDIPKYELSTGAIESYSIERIISEWERRLEEVEVRVAKQTPSEAADQGIASLVKSMSKFNVLPAALAGETAEEEFDRLTRHLETLEVYQQKMKKTYKVPVAFESSRSDNNIEFRIEAPTGTTLQVGDDYPISELPETHKPSPMGMSEYRSNLLGGNFANENRLYPYSYAEANEGNSKIKKINANRKYNLFDEDFYVQTSESHVVLTVTIHSEKLQTKQVIELPVSLEGAPTVFLV